MHRRHPTNFLRSAAALQRVEKQCYIFNAQSQPMVSQPMSVLHVHSIPGGVQPKNSEGPRTQNLRIIFFHAYTKITLQNMLTALCHNIIMSHVMCQYSSKTAYISHNNYLVSEMTYYVSSGTLNPTHSLTHSLTHTQQKILGTQAYSQER